MTTPLGIKREASSVSSSSSSSSGMEVSNTIFLVMPILLDIIDF